MASDHEQTREDTSSPPGSLASSCSEYTAASPATLPSSPIVRGAFLMRQPPVPRPWIWVCHHCKATWQFTATRRCLNDGHYYCKVPEALRYVTPRKVVETQRSRRQTSPPFDCPLPPPHLDLSHLLPASPNQPFLRTPLPSSRYEDESPPASPPSCAMEACYEMDSEVLAAALTLISATTQPSSAVAPTISGVSSPGDDTPFPHNLGALTPIRPHRLGPPAYQKDLQSAHRCRFARRDRAVKANKKIKKRPTRTCSWGFDVAAWQRWNQWRRRLRRARMELEEERGDGGVEVEGSRKRKRGDGREGGCWIDCDDPNRCSRKFSRPAKHGYYGGGMDEEIGYDDDEFQEEHAEDDEDEDDEDEDDEDEDVEDENEQNDEENNEEDWSPENGKSQSYLDEED